MWVHRYFLKYPYILETYHRENIRGTLAFLLKGCNLEILTAVVEANNIWPYMRVYLNLSQAYRKMRNLRYNYSRFGSLRYRCEAMKG